MLLEKRKIIANLVFISPQGRLFLPDGYVRISQIDYDSESSRVRLYFVSLFQRDHRQPDEGINYNGF